jgi:multiple sugar transport system ATP-binding protein
MAEVSLRQLTKQYPGGIRAVDHCTLAIADGACAVIVGPSGCGKSTLLRMIAGLETPDHGQILFDGRDVTSLEPSERNVAMIFQDFALYPHMTVRKNLAFAARNRGESHQALTKRVEQMARHLGLLEVLDRKPGQLSGGQRQRAAVGRVLLRKPACALYDEPMSNLDAALRMQIRQEIKQLHQSFATTSIFVTHDQDEAMSIGDMLVVMAEGQVQQIGSPRDVYRSPANRFVAGFIGSPPMNFIEGRIVHDGAAMQFVHDDFSLVLDDYAHMGGEPSAVLGIRPDDIKLNSTSSTVQGVCEQQQWLGHSAMTRLVTSHGVRFTVMTNEEITIGDSVNMSINAENIHLFEPGAFGRLLGSTAGSTNAHTMAHETEPNA